MTQGYTGLSTTLIDIVQAYKDGIADGNTLAFTFAFVPSKIVLSLSGSAKTSSNVGIAFTGHCVVMITGEDTFTSAYNGSGSRYTTAWQITNRINDTTNIFYAASADGDLLATGAWVTSTKTLTLTFQETGTTTASNFFEAVATAYR